MRNSTEEQRLKQSILLQRDHAQRYCALNDLTIAGFYGDEGVSGTVPLDQRPEGSRLLHDARTGRFGCVLIYKVDRLARKARLILSAAEELASLNVEVRSMTEPFDTGTPSGRLALTILAGFGEFERETTLERSGEQTERLAREGQWLGGIVPFGYRVEGEKRHALLVVNEQPLPGHSQSEASIVRLIYQMIADERASCQKVADHLNALGIPPAYVRDGRSVQRGKRAGATAGIWRAGRIRNLVVNTTYKGTHQYGKRTAKAREIIEREVPAIVSVEQWERAQQVLHSNMLFSSRNGKHPYLLRGLIKCGTCGLTYSGTCERCGGGKVRTYYRCNGRAQARGIYGAHGQKCPSKAITGEIEDIVWADIEEFGRNPGPILDRLAAKLAQSTGDVDQFRARVSERERDLAAKANERDAVIRLFRQGRIDATALDRQLDDIEREETTLRAEIDRLAASARAVEDAQTRLATARDLLAELNRRFDGPITWEV
jgi:site-specific DNA recombinase